jgi:tetratricopeptide (TPR) repeat protein
VLDALGKDQKGALEAPSALRTLAQDSTAPAITRATALERLGQYPGEKNLQALRAALASPEPLVVYGAVLGATGLAPSQRAAVLLPVLEHKLRAVRVAVGKALAGVRVAELPASSRSGLERAFAEVEQSFDVGASRAEAQVEKSAFELARGNLQGARASLQRALRLQPCLAEAYLNRADLERQRGDEAAAGRAIRSALGCDANNAAAHHALGLWQVRARKSDAALASFKKAVQLAPADLRFGYVLAVALAGRGDRDGAIDALETALRHHPNDTTALQTLAGYQREAGQLERAAETRKKLDTLLRQ